MAVEALMLSTDEWYQKLQAILMGAKDPGTAIRAICRQVAHDLKKSKWQNGCPIATVTLEAASTIPVIQKAASRHWHRWALSMRDFFAAHNIQVSEAMITTAIAAFEGGLLLARAHRSEKPLLQVGEVLAKLIAEAGTEP